VDAGFQPTRLDTLRTRTSAAYRGIYVLLQRQGSKDFFWKARMVDLDRDECKIDIHHSKVLLSGGMAASNLIRYASYPTKRFLMAKENATLSYIPLRT
jgi:hypothetical protein